MTVDVEDFTDAWILRDGLFDGSQYSRKFVLYVIKLSQKG